MKRSARVGVVLLMLLVAGGAHAASTCRVYALFEKMGMVFGPIDARYHLQGDHISLELGPEGSATEPSSPVRRVTDVPARVLEKAPAGTFMIGRNRNAWYFFTR